MSLEEELDISNVENLKEAIAHQKAKVEEMRKMAKGLKFMNQEEFMEHYHKRSSVETTFQIIKSKLGDALKSKNFRSQKNEMLCKIIAHNIVVLIHEMHELGIKPNF